MPRLADGTPVKRPRILEPPTPQQLELMRCVEHYRLHVGYAPSREEMATWLGISAGLSLDRHIDGLSKKRLLRCLPGQPRTIHLTSLGRRVLRRLTRPHPPRGEQLALEPRWL